MTKGPHRPGDAVSPVPAGRLVDRSRPFGFRFNGKRYSGLAGDTLASALLANGVSLVGRSPRFRRPRGLVGLGSEEPNGMVVLGRGASLVANMPATEVELREGLRARSQKGWPGLRFDAGAVAGWLRCWLPAGSSFKTFLMPGRNAWPFYAPLARRHANAGPVPGNAVVGRFDAKRTDVDVIVVGAGIAGLAAARAAAGRGARVMICEAQPQPGGLADVNDGSIEDRAQLEWADVTAKDLAADRNVTLLTRCSYVGHSDDGEAWLVQKAGAGEAAQDGDGKAEGALWRVRAREIVLATGAIERPLVFRGNDRPGIMLASAVRGYMVRYGIMPGSRGVLFTNNDDAYQTALALHETGAVDIRIIDTRTEPGGKPVMQCMAAGVRMAFGSYIRDVATTDRGRRIKGVHAGAIGLAGISGTEEFLECDFVCMSGGWTPTALHLVTASENRDASAVGVRAAGAANGTYELAAIIAEAQAAGELAAGGNPVREPAGRATDDAVQEPPPAPSAVMPDEGARRKSGKHNLPFVDYRNDVTAQDVVLAVREGYRALEQLQGYTRLGLGADQGKTSLANGEELRRQAARMDETDAARVQLFEPLVPVPAGALAAGGGLSAASAKKELPAAEPPVSDRGGWLHLRGWHLPRAYPEAGEDSESAAQREADALRAGAVLADFSARGTIEIGGDDAATFLERACSAEIRAIGSSAFDDGLLLDDFGAVVDACRIEHRPSGGFALVTALANAERVSTWLGSLHRSRWDRLSVDIRDMTESRARLAIAGPGAAEAVAKLKGDIVRGGEIEPGTSREGTLLGSRARISRMRILGEDGFEIAIERAQARTLWAALTADRTRVVPIGFETLRRLGMELGLVDPASVASAGVSAAGLGLLDREAVKQGGFVGKRAVLAETDNPAGSLQLVGVECDDFAFELPAGASAVAHVPATPPAEILGHVVCAGISPALQRPIALALLRDGRARIGEAVYFPLERSTVRATITHATFLNGGRSQGRQAAPS